MFLHFKRFFKQILTYGLGETINKIAVILTLPIFTRFLTPHDYGVAAILTVTNALIVGIADLGLTNSVFRYWWEEKEKNKLVTTAQLAMIGLPLIIAILSIPFGPAISQLLLKTPDYAYIITLNFWSIPLSLYILSPLARIRMEEKAGLYTVLTVTRVLTGIGLNVFLIVFMNRGLNGLFEGPLINAAIYAFFIGIYSFIQNGFGFSSELFRKMFKFGFPFVLALGSFWIMDWADRFVLQNLTNLSEVGLYNLGYSLGMAVMLPVGAFATAWPPFYMSISKEENASVVYSKIFTYYSLVIGFIVLGISMVAPDFFRITTPENYHTAYIIVPLITLAYALKGNFLIASVGSFIKDKPILQVYTEIGAMIVNLIMMFTLIPLIGRIGAAWATLVAYLFLTVGIWFVSRKLYPVKYEYFKLFKIILVGLGLYFIAKQIYEPDNFNLALRILILLLYPVALYFLGFFKNNELSRLKGMFTRLKPTNG